MIRNLTMVACLILGLVVVQAPAVAASNGTPEEAKAMVDKAAKLLASEGPEKAYAAIDDASGAFVDRDLYVFVISLEGTVVAHGVNKALIGKSIINLRDSNGKAFVQEVIDLAKSSGEGWVDYTFPNPVTKKVDAKSSFIRKVGDVVVGVGIYKQ